MHASTSTALEMQANARRLLVARFEHLRAAGGASGDELEELMAALRRLDDGTWGSCLECGEAIGRNRLLSLPEARTCCGCAWRRPS